MSISATPRIHPCQLDLNPTDRVHLEAIIRRSSSSQQLTFRALVVLMVADGSSISGAARALGCSRQTVVTNRRLIAPLEMATAEKIDAGPAVHLAFEHLMR